MSFPILFKSGSSASLRRVTALFGCAALLLSACSGDPRPLEEAAQAEELGLARLVIESEQVDLDNTVINPGQSVRYTFKAFDMNNAEISKELLPNTDRRWSVSNFDVADITDFGKLTASRDGAITVGLRVGGIVAERVSVLVSSAELAVLDGITGPDELTECSISEPYTATGTFTDGTVRPLDNLEWQVVSSPSGRLLSSSETEAVVGVLQPGSISLIATSGEITDSKPITVVDGIESLTISPSPVEVERSANLSLLARANYTDEDALPQNVTSLATWEIEEGSTVASVSDDDDTKGVLRGLVIGQTQVFAECFDATASATVTVVEPANIVTLRIEPDDDPVEMFINGSDVQLKAFAVSSLGSDEEVTDRATWRVESGTEIISVDNSTTDGGLVTALAVGRATIEVSYADASQTIAVIVR